MNNTTIKVAKVILTVCETWHMLLDYQGILPCPSLLAFGELEPSTVGVVITSNEESTTLLIDFRAFFPLSSVLFNPSISWDWWTDSETPQKFQSGNMRCANHEWKAYSDLFTQHKNQSILCSLKGNQNNDYAFT